MKTTARSWVSAALMAAGLVGFGAANGADAEAEGRYIVKFRDFNGAAQRGRRPPAAASHSNSGRSRPSRPTCPNGAAGAAEQPERRVRRGRCAPLPAGADHALRHRHGAGERRGVRRDQRAGNGAMVCIIDSGYQHGARGPAGQQRHRHQRRGHRQLVRGHVRPRHARGRHDRGAEQQRRRRRRQRQRPAQAAHREGVTARAAAGRIRRAWSRAQPLPQRGRGQRTSSWSA